MSTRDIFEPRREPARTIYLAFQEEAAKRRQRPGLDWIELERQAVHAAASKYAQEHGLREPSLDEIKRAENYARGSIDYGAKWAYGIAERMAAP